MIRKRYDTHKRYSFETVGESRTQQQFAIDCDVNHILGRCKKTGVLDHVNKIQGTYGEFSNIEDYQSMLEKVYNAESAFMALPSTVREKFANSPNRMIAFLSDSKNDEEAIKLGLKIKPTPKNPETTTTTNQTTTTTTPETQTT